MSDYEPDGCDAVFSARPQRDPDADALVRVMEAGSALALSARGVAGARDYLEQRAAAGSAGPRVDEVTDALVGTGDGSVVVRIYRPKSSGALAAVVYLHGGGWVVGSLAASDAFCRRLADAATCVVFSVEYRLAPEHPYPAGLRDACAAARWVAKHAIEWGADPNRLILMGDSAGGNLATVTARILRSDRVPVARQILAYPGVAGDAAFDGGYDSSCWPLNELDRQWFLKQYLPDGVSATSPDIAPLWGDLRDMPPTTMVLGGCDPLFDEGLAYARELVNAGVSVDLHVYSGQIHGFLTMDDAVLPTSRQALGVVVNAIDGS